MEQFELFEYVLNDRQSSFEELDLLNQPEEILELFYDFINNVPYIKYLISDNRLKAKDIDRDSKGRIIVDITKPHILENMDYFMPAAMHYRRYGTFTDLRPNPNPNSEYGKWIREEVKRCHEGYVRESDGEWVPGLLYFFLNYCPIPLTKTVKGSKKGERIIDFPEFWEGIYYRFHYIELMQHGGLYNEAGGMNGCEVSRRGSSKSLCMGAIMAKYFVLGESKSVNRAVKCMTVAYLKQYLNVDGILNKFQSYIDFVALNTEFPRKRLKNSLLDMDWIMGYMDLDTGTRKGTLNEVLGVSVKDDVSKARGKRLNFIIVEEFGSFPDIVNLYNIMLPSIQEGDYSFGSLYAIGTAGDSASDFAGAQELVYNPKGYRMYAIPNVFDKEGLGRKDITFFFPGYINRKGCYDKDGNSDVTKAILEILLDRYRVKYNSTDVNSITKTIAEIPITPQEAIIRARGNFFPITQINERINQIDALPNFYDDVWCGDLVMLPNGTVEFRVTGETPIRDFPLKDNTAQGCIEIFEMPKKDSQGKISNNRYIVGFDPYDADLADSHSLGSCFVLDLFSDNIVAEYTGRTTFAENLYEKVRLLCLFYNAKCLYESNIRGCFSYFSKMNSLHLLADTPEYLRERNLVKYQAFGNSIKGVRVNSILNNFGNTLLKDWLLQPVVTVHIDEEGLETETSIPKLYEVKNRALLKELSLYNPDINVDRIRALAILMMYREEKLILYQGTLNESAWEKENKAYLGNDDYFTRNYDNRIKIKDQKSTKLNSIQFG